MAAGDRSLVDVLRDVIHNVQDIVRSEVLLAKMEIREEAAKAKSSLLVLLSGVALALFAILFLLITVVLALTWVIPLWAATLSTGAALALVGIALIVAGRNRLRQLNPKLDGKL